MKTIAITFRVNDQEYTLDVEPNMRLLDLLRDTLHLTGTKEGCSVGECGACTVLFNGKPVNSCLVLAPQVEGASIETVEGLEQDGQLHPLQESFIEHMAVQCGYCTPGMLMATWALLKDNPRPSEEEIRTGISGVLCRCTGYEQIVRAIEDFAQKGLPL